MIQFICDSCAAIQEPAEVWIVGLAAESVGVTAARREVTIQSAWDRPTAVHPLAVAAPAFRRVKVGSAHSEKLFDLIGFPGFLDYLVASWSGLSPDGSPSLPATSAPRRSLPSTCSGPSILQILVRRP